MNVAEYFEQAFPAHRYAEGDVAMLAGMPLESVCGEACRDAIQAAKVLRDQVRLAYGHDNYARPLIQSIADVAINLCGLFICG